MDELSPAFRKWPIMHSLLEYRDRHHLPLHDLFLAGEINAAMLYTRVLVRVISAVLLLISGRAVAEKQQGLIIQAKPAQLSIPVDLSNYRFVWFPVLFMSGPTRESGCTCRSIP
jgi:hypothetical protein